MAGIYSMDYAPYQQVPQPKQTNKLLTPTGHPSATHGCEMITHITCLGWGKDQGLGYITSLRFEGLNGCNNKNVIKVV